MRVLDVGCGIKKHDGAVGIDRLDIPEVDVVWDLDRHPWPVEESGFDLIILSHVLEHLKEPAAALAEARRAARNGGEVRITTPHFSSLSSWKDPTHLHHFALETFDFFTAPSYGTGEPQGFELIERRLTFRSGLNSLIGRIIFNISPSAYERSAAFRYPARNMIVRLRVLK